MNKKAIKRFLNLFNFSVAVILLTILAQNISQAQKYRIGPSNISGFSFIDTLHTDSKVDSMIDYALSLEGIPYKWGGKTMKGFDCSGFIYHVYNKFEIEVPGGSANQYQLGEPVAEKDIQKGDLLFFTGTDRRNKRVGHVGFVISTEDGIKFAHSSSAGGGKGVTVNDLDHPGYRKRFLGAKRLINPSEDNFNISYNGVL
ncbi:C40 family peptidase [Anditalea andensis]|uniref:NlpC/P60 domain-containing protein n=1 Tax=Anditalea andensis TaxID=1048983 RepID=A0A074KYZ7_9BACT|nr:C40 family peptidase [Anditalea andensis]KEO74119.1 hypothetical protein EL17_08220 [Anditalea andensis]